MNRERKLLQSFCSVLTLALATIEPSCATTAPTLSTANGVYNQPGSISPNPVTISAPSGTIYFTIDGSTPTASSQVYSSGINIQSSTQINTIAIASGVSSTVTSGFYSIDPNITNLSVPKMWFMNSFGPNASSPVAFWPDMSLNNLNATQTVVANQPGLIADAINELQALSFNGTSSSLQLPSTTFTSSGLTIFAVVNPGALASSQIVNFSGATAPQNLIGLGITSSGFPQYTVYNSAGTSSTAVTSASALPANQFHLVEVVQGDIAAGTATLYIDNTQVGQSTVMNSVPAAALPNNFIGKASTGTGFLNGRIAELLVYTTPLTTSQRAAVEAFLISKYQIPSQVPTAPIISIPSGSLSGPSQVAITAQSGVTIHATTNGTTPNASSPVVAGPINVNYSLTLKTIAISDTSQSTVSSATYTLPAQFPAPAASGPALKINLTLPSSAIP